MAAAEAAVAELAAAAAGIVRIELSRSAVEDGQFEPIVAAATSHPDFGRGLRLCLSLEGNGLTDASVNGLVAMLPSLEELNIGYNKLSEDGVIQLADGIKEEHPLRLLNLTFIPIRDGGAEALAAAVRRCQAMRTLRVYRCHVEDDGVYALACAIADRACQLENLDLGCNGFGSAVVPVLGAAIAAGTLEYLGLRNNDLRPSDVVAIGEGLAAPGTALKHLDLRKNKLMDRGVINLVNYLAQNTSLTSLDIRSNKATVEAVMELTTALEQNHTLLQIELDAVAEDADSNVTFAYAVVDTLLAKNTEMARLRLQLESAKRMAQPSTVTMHSQSESEVAEVVFEREDGVGSGAVVALGVALAAAFVLWHRPGCPAAF